MAQATLEAQHATRTTSYARKAYKDSNQRQKERAQAAAVNFLEHRGYEVLERNWSCLAGTTDIIAKQGDCLVFINVQARGAADKGFPEEAKTNEMRPQFEQSALAYLADHDYAEMSVRYDNIAVVVIDRCRALVRHHVNALAVQ